VQPGVEFVIRGRCVCGKRYRLLHARAGTRVNCPHCGRAIAVSDTAVARAVAAAYPDGANAAASEPLREAQPVDFGELRLAPAGSHIGLTGKKAYHHEEAMLAAAMGGAGSLGTLSGEQEHEYDRALERGRSLPRIEMVQRSFWADLLATFYLAGSPRNLLNLAATAAALLLSCWAASLLPGPLGFVASFVVDLVCLAYLMSFFWSVLSLTANGEEELPLIPPDWDLWEDVLRPVLWLTAISIVCSVPWFLVRSKIGGIAWPEPTADIALIGGWFFWPAAVLVIGVGGTWHDVLPHRLAGAIVRIGLRYVIVWGLVILLLFGVGVALRATYGLPFMLVIDLLLCLYAGYALFRTLGLLYRHSQRRLRWV
jgi:hypothetical protein